MRFGAYYQYFDREDGGVSDISMAVETFEEWLKLMKYSGIPAEDLRWLYDIVNKYGELVREVAYFNDGKIRVFFNLDARIKELAGLLEEFNQSPNPELPFHAEIKDEWPIGFHMEVTHLRK